MSNAVATVAFLQGQAWAKSPDGSLRPLSVGSVLNADEILVTAQGAKVELDTGEGQLLTVQGGQEVAMSRDFNNETATSPDEALLSDASVQEALTVLEQGGDLTTELEETAAGNTGGGAGEGHGFVQLARVIEATDPLAFSFDAANAAGAGTPNADAEFPRNNPPEVVDQQLVFDEDTILTGQIIATDVENDTLTYAVLNAPTNGVLTLDPITGAFTFTPNENYNGADSFVVTVTDDAGNSVNNTISLTITAVNDAPVSSAQPVVTNEDTPVTGQVVATDVENDVLSFAVTTNPANGVVNINTATGVYEYTPNPNFNGVDSFVVTVADGNGGISLSTVSVTITPVNDAPVATNQNLTTAEDTPINGQIVASDVDNDPLTYSLSTAPANGSLLLNPNGSFTYTPNPNYNGSDSFVVTVSDGFGGLTTSTISIGITPVNDAPVAANRTLNVAEDTQDAALNIAAPSDVDGDTLTITVAGLPSVGTVTLADGTPVTNGQVLTAQELTSLRFDAPANVNSIETGLFQYSVSDGQETVMGTITINVTPANDAPVANNLSITTDEDTAYVGQIVATDIDGDTLGYSINTMPTKGTLTLDQATGQFTYTPNVNYNGGDSFSVLVSDGRGGIVTSVVTVGVTPVNDAPIANPDLASTPINQAITVDVRANDTDVDNLRADLVVSNPQVDAAQGTATLDAQGRVVFTPALNFSGVATIAYTLTDPAGLTSIGNLTVNVGANTAPTGADNVITLNEDGSHTFAANNFGFADADAAQTFNAVRIDTLPTAGSLTLGGVAVTAGQIIPVASLATLVFTPAPDANGNNYANFTFSVQDSLGAFDLIPNTIQLNVTPVNDAPIAQAASFTVAEDAAIVTGSVIATDVDAGAVLTFALNIAAPAGLTFNADGSYSFDASNAAYQSLGVGQQTVLTIPYTVTDDQGATSIANLEITVTGTNDAPVAQAASFTVAEDAAIVNGNVTANDIDANATYTYALNNAAPAGLTFNADGSYSFDATNAAYQSLGVGQQTVITIPYTVTDDQGATSIANLVITVTGTNDAPVAQTASFTVAEDAAIVNGNVTANDIDANATHTYALNIAAPAGLTFNADGSYSFDATNTAYQSLGVGQQTILTIPYTVTDDQGATSVADLVITVTGTNDGPVANTDVASTPINAPVVIDVRANDSDIDDAQTDLVVSNPQVDAAQGSVTLDAQGRVVFTPALNFSGLATITYTLTDPAGGQATGNVTVNVGANTTPTGADNVITLNEDGSHTFAANDFGFADADALQTLNAVRIDTLPAAGSLTLGGVAVTIGQIIPVASISNLVFTPAADANGVNYANFTFSVQDSAGAFDAAPNAIQLNVAPVNDAPTLNNPIPDQTENLVYESSGASTSTQVIAPGTPLFQSFYHNSGNTTYSINSIDLQLVKDPSASAQTITVTLLSGAHNGVELASATISSADIDNSLTWKNFDFSSTMLVDNQLYFIRVESSGMDGLVSAAIHNTDVYSNGSFHFSSGAPDSRDLAFQITTPNPAAVEDRPYSFTVPANTFGDIDTGDVISYSAQLVGGGALPGWLSFDPLTRTFSGTPTNGDVGTISVEVIATDIAGATASDSFTIAIANTNDAPTVSNIIPDQNATEDAAFNFQFASNTFADLDFDPLAYTAQLAGGGALPSWLVFDSATRTFSGTPANGDVGTVSIDVIANDGNGGTVTDTFNLVVANVNDAPTLDNAIANQNATEDSAFNFTFPLNSFSDVDVGDVISYSAQLVGGGALPAWLSFDANTRTFSGTPANGDVGTISVEVIATDIAGATATDNFDIVIANTNDDPAVLNVIPNQNATEDAAFNFQFSASTFTDIDAGDVLTYTAQLAGGGALPTWLSFDSVTRTFSGIPLNADVGTISVSVTANDGNGGTVTDTFDIQVANTNDAPTLDNSITDQGATENTAFNFTFPINSFSDVDVGDVIGYSAQLVGGGALPAWLNFDSATRTFSGTPANGDVGTISVQIIATDLAGATATDNFDIVIANTNDDPTVLNVIPNQNAIEDAAFNFQFSASTFADIDAGTTLTYTAELAGGGALPSWLSFDSATRTFSGLPLNADVGTISVSVTANDGNGGTVTDTFDIQVANTNDTPTLDNSILDQNATEDSAFNFTFPINSFSDVDVGDVISYSAQLVGGGALPAWLSFDSATRTFSGTPINGDVGTISVQVIATDIAGATATDNFDIVIGGINDAPVNTVPAAITMNEDTTQAITGLSISDIDSASGNLTVTLQITNGILNVTGGSAIIAASGTNAVTLTGTQAEINSTLAATVNYVPTTNFNGTSTLTITTNDNGNSGVGGALSDVDTVTITVNPIDDATQITPVSQNLTETNAILSVNGTINAVDVDSPAGFIAQNNVAGSGGFGLFTLAANGQWSYSTNNAQNQFAAGTTYTDTLTVTALDGTTSTITVNILGTNDAPGMSGLVTSRNYSENAGGGITRTIIDTAVVLTDVDSANFAGGNVTVTINNVVAAQDQLTVQNQGTGVNQINVSGTNVSYNFGAGAVLIGTISGGTLGAPLVISLNNNATPVAVDALVQRIAYGNSSQLPNTTPRSITFSVTDGDGTANGGADTFTQNITLNVASNNDAPVLGALGGARTYTEGGAAVVLDTNATIADGELAALANFGGMTLTVGRRGGINTDDDFVGAGTLSLTAGNVVLNGVTVGSYNAAQLDAGQLLITFANGVTNAQATSVLRQIAYRNTSDVPPSSLIVDFVLNDGNTGAQGSGGARNSTTVGVTVNITGVNDAPVAQALTLNGTEETNLPISLTGSDVDGTIQSIQLVSLPTAAQGVLYLADGVTAVTTAMSLTPAQASNLIFTPTNNFNGNVSFNFIVRDNLGLASAPATVNISVAAVNDAPVNTVPPAITMNEDTTQAITGLSVNDVDAGSTSITVTLQITNGILNVSGGSAVIAGNGTDTVTLTGTPAEINSTLAATVNYVPTNNFSGSSTLTITTNDNGNSGVGGALSDVDTVTITVNAIDDGSVANQNVSTNEDIALNGNLPTTDADGAVTYAVITNQATANGTFSVETNGAYTYTPNSNFAGNDSVVVNVTDSQGFTTPVTVNVTVNPINDAPTANSFSLNGTEDNNVAVNLSGSDIDGTVQSIQLISLPTVAQGVLYLADGVTAVTTAMNLTPAQAANLIFTPAANFNGNVSFTFTVTDNDGLASNPASVDITIAAVNDAPVNALPTSWTTNEDTSVVLTGLSVSDIDSLASDITVTLSVSSGNLSAVSASGVTVSGTGTSSLQLVGSQLALNAFLASGSAPVYQPAANANGSVSLTMTTSDGGNTGSGGVLIDTDTAIINITSVNDAPVLQGESVSTNEDAAVNGNLLANDIDVDSTLTIGSFTWNGTTYVAGTTAMISGVGSLLVNSNGSYTFTPSLNFAGSVPAVTYQVQEDGVNFGSSNLNLSIAAVNDAPVNNIATPTFNTTEGTARTITGLSISDVDAGSGIMSVTLSVSNGSITVNSVTNGASLSGTGTSIVTLSGTVAQINASLGGTVTYTPATNFFGSENVIITTNDQGNTGLEGAKQDQDSVMIQVASIRNPGEVAAANTRSVAEGNTITNTPNNNLTGQVLGNDGGTPASQSVTSVSFTDSTGVTTVLPGESITGRYGILTLNANGTYSYSATTSAADSLAAGQLVYDLFVYNMTGSAGAGSASLTFTVTGTNDAPVITAGTQSVTGSEDSAYIFNWAQFGVSDVDVLNSLQIRVISLPADGQLQVFNGTSWVSVTANQNITKATIDADRFRFVPDANESGSDAFGGSSTGNMQSNYASFDYQGFDGTTTSSTATMVIDITPVVDDADMTLAGAPIVDGSVVVPLPPTSEGLTVRVYGSLASVSPTGVDTEAEVSGLLELLNAETPVSTSISSTPQNYVDADGPGGDNPSGINTDGAYRVTGLIFLEAGKTYTFSSYMDDTSVLRVGGTELLNQPYNNWGIKTANTFVPAVAGYYSLDWVVYNGDGIGAFKPWLSVDGGTALELNTTNYKIYSSINSIDSAGADYEPFITNGAGGHYPVTSFGVEDSFIQLSPISVSLVDTDGSEAIVGIYIHQLLAGTVITDGINSFTAVGTTSVNVSSWNLSSLQLRAPANFSGNYTLNIEAVTSEVATGTESTRSRSIVFYIEPTNDSPAAVADTAALIEGSITTVTGNLLANDQDVDGDIITVQSVNGSSANVGTTISGSFGTLVVQADGSYTYSLTTNNAQINALNNSESVRDIFTYRVTDPSGATSMSSLIITIQGTTDAVTITGTLSDDNLPGTSGDDVIQVLTGNDFVNAGAGHDVIQLGGANTSGKTFADIRNDQLMTQAEGSVSVTSANGTNVGLGGTGNDAIVGGDGFDLAYGGDGDDYLYGGALSDGLRGGVGNDRIEGGSGNDVMRGDAGADVFVWKLNDQASVAGSIDAGAANQFGLDATIKVTENATDLIMDFSKSETDALDLRDLLQGETHLGTDPGNLTDYLHFETTLVNGVQSTVVHVSSHGNFASGYDAAQEDMTIILSNVNLRLDNGGATLLDDRAIIQDLLTNNRLITD